ncbi:hypothetical protein [Actinomadura litoris]|uniref:hypothetical protein n=1 Tax=Actinomadura litoris TaxID=2678616 RepID=UPI001FA70384|nr:hypothetical protein [Actinomadura litoris]
MQEHGQTSVGGYVLKGESGVFLLLDPKTEDICSMIVCQGDGTWRARTPDGQVVTLTPPDDVERPALWVATQITATPEDAQSREGG